MQQCMVKNFECGGREGKMLTKRSRILARLGGRPIFCFQCGEEQMIGKNTQKTTGIVLCRKCEDKYLTNKTATPAMKESWNWWGYDWDNERVTKRREV